MPRLDVATTSQAVPLYSKARLLGKAISWLIGSSWWRVSSSSHTPSMIDHRQWPSGIEGLLVSEPREPISLGASFILGGR